MDGQIDNSSSEEDKVDESDEEMMAEPATGSKRKSKSHNNIKKKQPLEGLIPGFDPRAIIRQLDTLMSSKDMYDIHLYPMNRYERYIEHTLAWEFKIKVGNVGKGVLRIPVFYLCPRSKYPFHWTKINQVLVLFDTRELVPERFYNTGNPNPRNSVHASKRNKKQKKQQPMSNMHGKMVTENVPEVGASNVGHRMLARMGWKPGQGLGVTGQQGRSAPVDVMIRTGYRGLGA